MTNTSTQSTAITPEKFLEIISTDGYSIPQENLVDYRKDVIKFQQIIAAKLSETSRKELVFDDAKISEYIKLVLQDGFALKSTTLSSHPHLADAQCLKRFKSLISKAVAHSSFGKAHFKVHSLRKQRSDIAHAKTLHELRMAVDKMIPVLELYRELEAFKKQTDCEILYELERESLLLELEEVTALSLERKRIIDATCSLYDDNTDIVKSVDDYKQRHLCTDKEACAVFGINVRTLQRTRKDAKATLEATSTLICTQK